MECLEGFFAQQSRVLKPGGLAIHHFPTVESLVDPHSGVPFGHWSRSDVSRVRNLRFFSVWVSENTRITEFGGAIRSISSWMSLLIT